MAQNVALPVTITIDKRTQSKLQVGVDIPTPDEIQRILSAAITPKSRALMHVAVFTGLRASELRGLRWPDVDLMRSELHIRQRADHYNVLGAPKSEKAKRTLSFGPIVLNALKQWKLACPNNEFYLVFPSVNGRIAERDHLADIFHAAQIAASVVTKDGKPKYAGLHMLRHFFASWCINSKAAGGRGLQPKEVQEQLGHATIGITMDTYGHLFPRNDNRDELAAAERALLGLHAA